MRFLGMVQEHLLHNTRWISDYRNPRLIPVSNKVLIGTILVIAIGVIAWHLLPASLSGVAIGILFAGVAHLGILVIGGLSLVLLLRHQRHTARQMVITSIPWQGSENVLDVGCGTGMLLNGCARQLTTGKAIGVDLWQQPVAGTTSILMQNAQAEGVADRIAYQEMDARRLTFENGRFNVVTSSFALHHIGTQPEDRAQAVSEMIRVLKPGGYFSLLDVGPMIDIAESVIAHAGLQIVRQSRTRFFRMVTARKV